MINVSVNKHGTENALSLLRRFTKKVQGSGVLNKVRGMRYSERKLSHYKIKQRALVSLSRKAEKEKLLKLGKIKEVQNRRIKK